MLLSASLDAPGVLIRHFANSCLARRTQKRVPERPVHPIALLVVALLPSAIKNSDCHRCDVFAPFWRGGQCKYLRESLQNVQAFFTPFRSEPLGVCMTQRTIQRNTRRQPHPPSGCAVQEAPETVIASMLRKLTMDCSVHPQNPCLAWSCSPKDWIELWP